MTIAFDARFWGGKHTGLGIYTQNLVENIAKIDTNNHYILLVRAKDQLTFSLPVNFESIVVDADAYTLKEQIIVPFILYKLNVDLVHFPSINAPIFYLKPYVVTIHDLIKHHSRGVETTTKNPFVYWLKYLAYLFISQWLAWASQKIIVPTQTVKSEVAKTLKISPSKIVVTYEAAVTTINIDSKGKLENLPDKFALYVGNAYPHKNLAFLISAWKDIYQITKLKLVLAGGRSVFYDRLEKIILHNNAGGFIHHVGLVSGKNLQTLFHHARLYVFPTLMEGFGLPGLEAMRQGTPVVCSDIPVLHEIYADAAYYFNPRDRNSLLKSVVAVSADTTLRQRLITSGEAQVKKYSWEKMARETIDVYESCVRL